MENTVLTKKQAMMEVFEALSRALCTRSKKAVSTYDILDELKTKDIAMSHQTIRAILDTYIKLKYVRYFVNEKKYIYFGITEFGCAKYALHVAQHAQQDASQQVAVDNIDSVVSDEITISQQDVQAPPKAKRGRPRKATA